MEQHGPFRNLLRRLNNGLLVVLKPLQIVNNFLFLAVAYFVGVGFSSVLYRLGPGKKIRSADADALKTGASNLPGRPADPVAPESPGTSGTSGTSGTYWRPVASTSREAHHWLRPF